MQDDLVEDTLYIHYKFKFSICRLVDNMLVPSVFEGKADIEIIEEDGVELALRKINYWLTNIVSASVAVYANNAVGFGMLLDEDNSPRLNNPLMICPDEPTDDHFCVLMQSKLQALSGGAFAVGLVELTSDNATGLMFTYIGDCEEILPSMEEWVSGPTWFDRPWWARDDGTLFDTIAPEGTDLTQPPNWAIDLGFLAHNTIPRDAIVLKGDFKPRIIDGETGEK